ncbi:M48 family metallopeptidase [Crossiella sp. CA-258035]|uniref:M48 family metallopeptidase n=1 Tax=Crossiella sp. CA-258035 TaxID=2981138 RepID=UPI0024BD5AD0|nr:M48 family metallopeptidase [Crossiella sp. CA-258035]WHT19953.1 M48 family metallopeptidase [Crossiella sp. CA-258035]
MRAPLRAVAALVVLLGFFVLVLALTAGLALFAVWLFTESHGPASIQAGLAAIGVAVAVGAALRKVLKVRNEPYGARLVRAEYPELWRTVDELAVAADTRGPDDIRLVPEVNAAVWEDTSLLGLRTGKRYLMIGLPLLAGLTVAELRAVLAHELGHYSHGHTRLSALTYRATEALEKTLEELRGSLVGWLLARYARLYALVAGASNRAQELQADAASVTAAGKAATASALRKISALAAAWEKYSEDYVGMAPEAGRTPELLAGFRAFLAEADNQERLAALEEEFFDAEPSSVFDSHPPVRVRVAALAQLPDVPPMTDARPAWALLGEAAAVPRLEQELLADDLGPRASWPEIVELAGAAHVTGNAGVLAKTAVDGGFATTGTLAELLGVVRRGQGAQLVAPLVNQATPPSERAEALRRTLVQLLGDTVLALLVRHGKASFELNWSGPWVVRDGEGEELEVHQRIATALAEHDHDGLRDWLTGLGVPLAEGVEQVEFALSTEVLGIFTSVKSGEGRHDLFVCDNGLLLVPVQRAKALNRGVSNALGRTAKREAERVEALLEAGFGALRDRADSRWIGIEEVVSGKLGPRPWGWTADLRLTSGELSVRSTTETTDHGEPYEGIGALLAHRAQAAGAATG